MSRSAVETHLQPGRQVSGVPAKDILTRMQELHVPNASITMIVDGEIVWSRDYDGKAQTASDQRVDGHAPVFQAGSISKTINAVLAMKLLVEAGKIGLEDDLTDTLKAIRIHNNTGKPITLAQLLSHTGGTNVHGFPGYPTNAAHIPTTAEVLAGNSALRGPNNSDPNDTLAPNTEPVEIVREPGGPWQYSGGGTTIVQRLIEMAYPDKTYAELAQEHIFQPLGMTQSTFELQFPGRSVEHIQQAHDHEGRVIKGGWRLHPESGAAGLWTTTRDLAKFSIAIHAMSIGAMQNPILHPTTVQKMLVRQPPNSNFGLGFRIYGGGDAIAFGHGGVTEGFCSDYVFFPKTNTGAVIFTNGILGRGTKLVEEIYSSIAENYDWAQRKSVALNPVVLNDAMLQRCVGEFASNNGMIFVSKIIDGQLQLSLPGFDYKKQAKLTFVPLSETTFFCVEHQFEVTFDSDYNAMTFMDGLHSKRNDIILSASDLNNFVDSIYQTIKNNYIFSIKPELEESRFKSALIQKIEKIYHENPRIDKKEFSDKINEFLSQIDPHLSLKYDPLQISDHLANSSVINDPRNNSGVRFNLTGIPPTESFVETLKRENYGFSETPEDKTEIPADIGYLKITDFFDPRGDGLGAAVRDKAHEFLQNMRGKKALVIDLRGSHGGSPEMVEFILSYLLSEKDKEKIPGGVYNTIYDASTGQTKEYKVRPTDFCLDMPIRVLTDEHTFSAAEELAYDLQQINVHALHDDRILIVGKITADGKTTAGGAHPMTGFPLALPGSDIAQEISQRINPDYFLWVPDRTAVNPYTGTNWEDGPKKAGEKPGVKPDVEIPLEQNALTATLGELISNQTQSAVKILIVEKHNKTPAEENSDSNALRLQEALDQKHVQYEMHVTDEESLEMIAKQISDEKYDVVFIESGVNAIDIARRLSRDADAPKPKMIFVDGKIEDVADKAFSDAQFSGTMAVYKGDETIFAKGYQAENRYIPAVLNDEHTLFNIASMDKMITGLAIVMLSKEKHFSLDDKIVDHLPLDYPLRALFQNFTFHELLTHTSGLWRGGLMEGDAFGAQMANFEKVEEFLPMFFSTDQALQGNLSERGKHSYSNAGYLLLGLFIEATEGDYYQFIHNKILTPAGMLVTTEQRNLTSHFAIPYVPHPKNNLSKEPAIFTTQNILPEKLREITQKTQAVFQVAKECVQKYSIITELMLSYEAGLASAENMESFKAELLPKLQAAHAAFVTQKSENYFEYHYLAAAKQAESQFFELNAWLEENPQYKSDPDVQELQELLSFHGLNSNLHYPGEVINALTINLSKGRPHGCWYSNAEDMHAFAKALWQPDGVLHQYAAEIEERKVITHPGNPDQYGCGSAFIDIDGVKAVAHSGKGPGICTNFSTFPDSGYTFVTLANDDSSNMGIAYDLENFIARQHLPGVSTSVLFLDPKVSVSDEPFESMVDNIAQVTEIKNDDHSEMVVGGIPRMKAISVVKSPDEREQQDVVSHKVLARTGGFISQDRAAQQRVQTTASAATHFPDKDNPNPAPGK